MSKLQDDQPDEAQSLQLGLAAASLHQSDQEIEHLLKQLRRQGATKNVFYMRPCTPALTQLASTAGTASTTLGSADLEDPQLVALLAATGQEREFCDINQEIVDNKSTNDSNSEDYSDMSNAAASEIQG